MAGPLSESKTSGRKTPAELNAPLAVDILLIRCDAAERYVFANSAYARHRQQTIPELMGKTVAEVVGAENYLIIRPYIERVLKGESVQYEERIFYPNVGYRTVSVSYEPELADNGEVRGWVSAISDVTELRESQSALIEARGRLESTLQIAEVGTWTWDVPSNRVDADRNLSRLFFGTEKDELPIEEFVQRIHPEDRDRVMREIQASLTSSRGLFECEYRVVRPDGGERWLIARGSVQRDEAGKPSQFSGAAIDITQRKHQEAAFEAVTRKMESQARMFDAVLSSIIDFVYTFDREGRFIFVNKPLLDLWGLSLEQAIGKNFFDLGYPDPLATRLQREIEQVFQTRQTVTGETAYTSPTGESGYFEYIFSPIESPQGEPEAVVGCTRVITERKRQESAVSDLIQRIDAQARLFDATLSHIADLAYTFDRDARVIYANKPLLDIWGLTLSEAVGKNCFDLKYPADLAEKLNGQLLEVVRTGQPVEGVIELASATGVRDVHEYIYNPVFDPNGKVAAVAGTTRLITHRIEIEATLRENERKLSRIMALMPAGVYSCDAQGRITFYNRRAAELWGYEPKLNDDDCRFCACHRVYLLDGTFVPPEETPMAIAIREGKSFRGLEAIVERPDGSRFTAGINIDPIFDDNDRLTGAINVFQDLTSTKEAQSAMRRLAAIVASSDDAIVSKDLNGIITSWNRGAERLFGYPPEEAIGQSVTILIPDDRADEEPGIVQKVRRGESIAHYETLRRKKDGTLINVSLAVSPIKNESGVIIGASKIARDISEQKRIEAELKESRDVAENANRAKDQFLAVLSHELRTPLTPVLMTVSARQMDATLPPALRSDLAMIRRNIELETKLIDDLLDLNRITSGKLNLRVESVDFNELVQHVSEICRSSIREKGIQFQCIPDPLNPQVSGDSARLQQVLWNLLKNAEKFTPEKGTITIRTSSDAKSVSMEISDTGAGIDPEILPRIFNAFEQGDARVTQQFGGLGLGLAISKALMELHQGSIRAESPGVGKGTTFVIELPRETAAQRTASIADKPAEPKSTEPLKLLIVEDHPDTAMVLAQLLKISGYETSLAHSVAEAMEFLKKETFDIMLSDLGLPDATGYELMKKARELSPVKGIAMSGYGMEEDIRKSMEAGFSEHLVKPVDILRLEQAIVRVAKMA